MRHRNTAVMIAAMIGLVGAGPGAADFSRLQVLRDVRAGMWEHTFTTIPKHPSVPNRKESACVSQAELSAMLQESLASGASEQICPVTFESDAMTMARFTMHCPATVIPELGVSAPGADIPGTIDRSAGQDHWVVTVRTPAVPGVTPAAQWRHEYRRLGSCPS